MDGLVDIVVVTADTPDLTERCVAALADGPVARVVVVDNGPRREAGRRIRQRFLTVEVVDVEPTGFAAACNAGAARGSAPYVLFLNSDVIARPGAIATSSR